MIIERRSFLRSIALLAAAPAIVRASSLMPVSVQPVRINRISPMILPLIRPIDDDVMERIRAIIRENERLSREIIAITGISDSMLGHARQDMRFMAGAQWPRS